jgi:hypothetical protein
MLQSATSLMQEDLAPRRPGRPLKPLRMSVTPDAIQTFVLTGAPFMLALPTPFKLGHVLPFGGSLYFPNYEEVKLCEKLLWQ